METNVYNKIYFNCYVEENGVIVAGLRCDDENNGIPVKKIAALPKPYKLALSSRNTSFNIFLTKDNEIIAAFTSKEVALDIFEQIRDCDVSHYRMTGLDYVDDIGCEFYTNIQLHSKETEDALRQAAIEKQNKARAERGEDPINV